LLRTDPEWIVKEMRILSEHCEDGDVSERYQADSGDTARWATGFSFSPQKLEYLLDGVSITDRKVH